MSDFTPRDALAEVLDGDQIDYRKAAEAANARCPAVTESGLPCQKRRRQFSDGTWDHSGGHMFMSDDTAACMAAQHYDPVNVLSLTPLVHLDVPCPRREVTP